MDKLNSLSQRLQDWALHYGPKLLLAIVILIGGLFIINRVTRVFSKSMRRREMDVSLQTFLSSLVNIALKVLLIITVAGMVGIQTTSFVAVVGALGLAIGLALQGSLANF